MIPAVPPFFSALRSLPEVSQASADAKLSVHSRYRSRPARPTHAAALQPRRSGASSAFPAPDFHQPSVLYAAFPAYYSPSPRLNWRICYHPPGLSVNEILVSQLFRSVESFTHLTRHSGLEPESRKSLPCSRFLTGRTLDSRVRGNGELPVEMPINSEQSPRIVAVQSPGGCHCEPLASWQSRRRGSVRFPDEIAALRSQPQVEPTWVHVRRWHGLTGRTGLGCSPATSESGLSRFTDCQDWNRPDDGVLPILSNHKIPYILILTIYESIRKARQSRPSCTSMPVHPLPIPERPCYDVIRR